MMNISTKLLFSISLVLTVLTTRAQQDPQFSQFMFNRSYFVPALTAAEGRTSLTFFSRSQWVGYDASFDQQGGAPNTQLINFEMPLTLLKLPVGVGGNMIYDNTGPLTNIYFQPATSYAFEFPRGALRLGVRPSLNNQRVDFSQFEFVNPNDVRNTGQIETQTVLDLDAGIAYVTEDYTIGLGTSHLLRPTYDYGLTDVNGAAVRTEIVYSVYGEYDYHVGARLTLSPTALIQTDINAFSYNAALLAKYNERMWGGLSYRDREALVIILAYSFFENQSLRVGYSFDYIVNDQEAKATSSHELSLKYYLPSISTGSKKIIRTPRFRF